MGDWYDIATAPMDGTRVRVAHRLDPSSMKVDAKYFRTTGVWRPGGWSCSAGFVCTDGMFRFEPTHWRPLDIPETASTERDDG